MNMNLNISNKRLRLSPVCDYREEPSASLKDLPNDVLKYCFSFIPGSYVTVGPVSKHFYSNYSTLGIHENDSLNSAETLLEIGKNRGTTADAVSSDLQLTEYCFIIGAPEKFMQKVFCLAASKSRRDIIECCKTFGSNVDSRLAIMSDRIMSELAEQGNLDMIKYLLEEHTYLGDIIWEYHWLEGVFIAALKTGNLEIMEWIHKVFPDYMSQKEDDMIFEFDEDESYEYKFGTVLTNGNIGAIKWFMDNVEFFIDNESINDKVAWRGSLEIFQAIEGHYQPIFDEETFASAAAGCSIEMLDYLSRNNCPFNRNICSYSLQNNTDKDAALAALKWLHHHNFPWDKETCEAAAFNDNLSALKWARNDGCSWDEKTLEYAVDNSDQNSNIEMLEYCLQNGCPLSSRACRNAMRNKDDSRALVVLKLLRKYSCPWDEETCNDGVFYGNFEAMIWARKNGCPWNPNSFQEILSYGSINAIEYFLCSENQLLSRDGILEAIFCSRTKDRSYLVTIPSDDDLIIAKLKLLHSFGLQLTAQACALAACYGRLRVLQWLKYMDCPWDVETCTGAVRASKMSLEMLKYAHENGCEWDKNTYAYCLRYGGLSRLRQNEEIPTKPMSSHVKIAQYLEENNCPKPNENDWHFREMN